MRRAPPPSTQTSRERRRRTIRLPLALTTSRYDLAMTSTCAVSAFSASIDPLTAVELGGFAGQKRIADPPATPTLECNGLILEDDFGPFLLQTVDSLYAGNQLAAFLSRDLNIEPSRILTVASHTHFAPVLDDTKPLLGLADPDHLSRVASSIAEAVSAAQPLGVGRISTAQGGKGPSVVRRRKGLVRHGLRYRREIIRSPAINSPTFAVDLALIHDTSDEVCAAMWSWPCHPVNEHKRRSVSADFPGAIRSHVRRVLGDNALPVLYFPGFAGDVRFDDRTWWNGLKEAIRFPGSPRFRTASAAGMERLVRDLSIQVDVAIDRQLGRPPQPCSMHHETIATDTILDGSPADSAIEFHCVSIFGVRLLAIAAEVTSPFYGLLEELGMEFMTGYAGSPFGYLSTNAQVLEGGYEPARSLAYFGLTDSRFRDDVDEAIVRAAERTVKHA